MCQMEEGRNSESRVKVAVRIRPLTAREILKSSGNCTSLMQLEDGSNEIILTCEDGSCSAPTSNSWGSNASMNTDGYPSYERKFKFEEVFDAKDSQEFIFKKSVEPIVENFLKGYNATLFVYGQTGSGKTYTMGTDYNTSMNIRDVSAGMIPRSLDKIFNFLESRNPTEFQYKVTASYIELYNEEFIDLMSPGKQVKNKSNEGPKIREDSTGKIVISNAVVVEAHTVDDLLDMLRKGSICRTTGSTDMNVTSSRSHAIFIITLVQHRTTQENSRETVLSKFYFVDLAGSERLKKTNATGSRMKEGISINQGLLALGNVISSLSGRWGKSGHIPYRDSKLTRLLQNGLGGNSETLMLACVSPSTFNISETLSTLNYATRASNICNFLLINRDPYIHNTFDKATFKKMERELLSLRSMASVMKSQLLLNKCRGSCHENIPNATFDRETPFEMHFHKSDNKLNNGNSNEMEKIMNYSELNLKCNDFQRKLLNSTNEACALRFICSKQSLYIDKLLNEISNEVTSFELNKWINEIKLKMPDFKIMNDNMKSSDKLDLVYFMKMAFSPCMKAIANFHRRFYFLYSTMEWYKSWVLKTTRIVRGDSQSAKKPFHKESREQNEFLLNNLNAQSFTTEIFESNNNNTEIFGEECDVVETQPRFKKLVMSENIIEKKFNTIRRMACERAEIIDIRNKLEKMFGMKSVCLKNFNFLGEYYVENMEEDEKESDFLKEEMFNNFSEIEAAVEEHQLMRDEIKSLKTELSTVTSSYNQKLQVMEKKLLSIERERNDAIEKLQSVLITPVQRLSSTTLRSLDMQNRRLKSELIKYKKKFETMQSKMSEFNDDNSVRINYNSLKSSLKTLNNEKLNLMKENKALKNRKKILQDFITENSTGKGSPFRRRSRQVKFDYTHRNLKNMGYSNNVDNYNKTKDIDDSDPVIRGNKRSLSIKPDLGNRCKKVRESAIDTRSDNRTSDLPNNMEVQQEDNENLAIMKDKFIKTLFEVVLIKRRQKLLNRIRASRNKLLLRRRELLLEREKCLMKNEEKNREAGTETDEREKNINKYFESTQLQLAKCESEMENLSKNGMYRVEKKWKEVINTIRSLPLNKAREICELLSVKFVRMLYDLQQNKHNVDYYNSGSNALPALLNLPENDINTPINAESKFNVSSTIQHKNNPMNERNDIVDETISCENDLLKGASESQSISIYQNNSACGINNDNIKIPDCSVLRSGGGDMNTSYEKIYKECYNKNKFDHNKDSASDKNSNKNALSTDNIVMSKIQPSPLKIQAPIASSLEARGSVPNLSTPTLNFTTPVLNSSLPALNTLAPICDTQEHKKHTSFLFDYDKVFQPVLVSTHEINRVDNKQLDDSSVYSGAEDKIFVQEKASSKIANIALRLRKVIGKVNTETSNTPNKPPYVEESSNTDQNFPE